MSDAVDLHLEEIEASQQGGTRVSGTARIEAHESVSGLELRIGLGVALEGPANMVGKSVSGVDARAEPVVEEEVELEAGETHAVEFSFEVPNGPAPLGVSSFDADWVVHAQIDAGSPQLLEGPGAEARTHLELTVDPSIPYDAGRRATEVDDLETGESKFGRQYASTSRFYAILGVLLILGVGGIGAANYSDIAQLLATDEPGAGFVMLLMAGLGSVVLGGWLVMLGIRRLRRASRLDNLRVEVDDPERAQGEVVEVGATLEGSETLDVEAAELALRRDESYGIWAGDNRRRESDEITVDTVEPVESASGRVESDTEYTLTFRIELPRGAPSTFELQGGRTTWTADWKVAVEFEFADGPAASASHPLLVHPAASGETETW